MNKPTDRSHAKQTNSFADAMKNAIEQAVREKTQTQEKKSSGSDSNQHYYDMTGK